MTRVVFDTSVLYSAILKPASVTAKSFDLVTAGLLIPCVSAAVLAEYRQVLLERPKLRHHAEIATKVLNILTHVALYCEPNGILNIFSHEPDNRFYECADAAQADYIITGNYLT